MQHRSYFYARVLGTIWRKDDVTIRAWAGWSVLLVLSGVLPMSNTLAEPVQFVSGTKQVQLLELYTSEGCSSCPPADHWLSQLKEDPRLWDVLVPVAFHVDYWDSLGWPDRFATAANSRRQRDLARASGFQVYTPGFVLNGREWRAGLWRREVPAEAGPEVGSLQLTWSEPNATAVYKPSSTVTTPVRVHLVQLGFSQTTHVQAGENRSRTLVHDFVVLDHQQALMTPSTDGLRGEIVAVKQTATQALAAWVAPADSPLPIQAVGGWLRQP